jgi:glucose/arabinose dehydrogenase
MGTGHGGVAFVSVTLGLCLAPALSLANSPPATPTILEPTGARLVNSADVHLETGPFVDPNPGDEHTCSDWEIFTRVPFEVVWRAECLGGVGRVHTHLGDGFFTNSHNGLRQLLPDTDYTVRVRHRDSSGDDATKFSEWASRDFSTGPASQVFPLELKDVPLAPVPSVKRATGEPYVLPSGLQQVVVRLENGLGDKTLLEVRGGGVRNELNNPSTLTTHEAIKAVVFAGQEGTSMPEIDLELSNEEGAEQRILLPAITLAAQEARAFWVSGNGSTFAAALNDTQPSFVTLARRNLAPWRTAPDFRVSLFATGFQLPVSIAFVPNPGPNGDDPFFYVSELYGIIKVVSRDGTVSDFATGLLNFNPTGNFPGSGEVGLAGLCVDPANGDVYASVVYSRDGNDTSPMYGAVERFTSTDGGRTSATRTRIFSTAPDENGPSHQISNVSIGPDQRLYVHVGDGFDITAGQDLTDSRGKILRMTFSGQPATDNPFYDAGDGITAHDYVYSYGMRNPFGGGWRVSDQSHYFVENGPGRDRLARAVAGRNFGFDGTDASMGIFAAYDWLPSVAPVNIAFLNPEIFANSGFPAGYAGRAYVTQSGATWGSGPSSGGEKILTEFTINDAGQVLSGPREVAGYNGVGKSSCSALAAGPDGLYFADLYAELSLDNPIARGASILRLAYRQPDDCNANGIPDAQDIAGGTSQDCNANLLPDECDIERLFSVDCNANGTPDECDVTAAITESFNDAPGPEFTFSPNSGLVNVGGGNRAVRLAQNSPNGEGAFYRAPISAQVIDRVHLAFDWRMSGNLQGQGMLFAILDAIAHPDSWGFDEGGPFGGVVGVRFNPGDPDAPAQRIELVRDRVAFKSATAPFDLDDGVWRRAEVSLSTAGLSMRVQTDLADPNSWITLFKLVPVPGFEPQERRFGWGARQPGGNGSHEIDNVTFWLSQGDDTDRDYVPNSCECNSIDFNRDGIFPDLQDAIDFFGVYGGGDCPSATGCDDVDFNRDGVFPDQADLQDFLDAFAGAPC